ncbi:magnesium/cobalt transporter CorA [Ulvibacter antarcticus]|uniref:Magnesium transport protein CorA n=1 Tax=Ulvibacter antarcticus TaxID=442714 RepID=A0A3L9Z2C2_9FLAO|nr:magnesium/cobalt transporter CorA [Ulvibacter antarcticus]RMA64445.1 magnesium transporter [Ulvibacter antarcticus]
MSKKNKFKIPKRKAKKIHNSVPGTVTYTGEKLDYPTKLEIIDFSKDHYIRVDTVKIEDAFKYKGSEHITWINVDGLSNTTAIEKLGEHYNLHPLIQEDIVTTNQRPKIDEYEDYLFIVFKMLHYNDDGEFMNEHVSLLLGKDFVVTFQEADGDVFDSLRDRLENSKGRIRNAGADYLMFAIIDAVVDNYFAVIETLSIKIEAIEDQLFEDTIEKDITQDIQNIKKEILRIRRAVVPLREVINRLEKIDSPLIDVKTQNYIRDLYDHIIQVSESVDIYREMIWGLMDMYMSTISNKMNEVMKVLTIMASIFIPLTFMAGIYGMNFDHIPELHFKYGYYYLWAAMLAVFIGMLVYFKRKKWL